MIVRQGRSWVLYSRARRVLGTHPTYAGAWAQERAIAASEVRARKRNGQPPSYVEAHWGLYPKDIHTAQVTEPGDNEKLITLGFVHSVVYVTKKGRDQDLVEYEHEFSPRRPPLLTYGSDDGRLYFVGGGYHISKHGIIG